MGFERHLHLARAEQAAGEAFGYEAMEEASPPARTRLIWLGGMTSIAGLIAAAAVLRGASTLSSPAGARSAEGKGIQRKTLSRSDAFYLQRIMSGFAAASSYWIPFPSALPRSGRG